MRGHVRALAVAGASLLTMALPVSAAWAADATGCSGSVVSKDAAGVVIGKASAPGDGGTQADPLPIDPQGTVAWKGSTDSVITDADWSVSIMGVTALSGTFANDEGLDASAGVQDLAALWRSLWSRGSAGVSVVVAAERDGKRINVPVASADRSKFLKAPRLH